MFMKNYGVLDYFKEIEYENICQFAQALFLYEVTVKEQVKRESEHKNRTETIK